MTSEHHRKKNINSSKKQNGTEALSKKRWNAVYHLGAEKEWGLVNEYIPELVRLLVRRGAKTVLDLGCGSGGHIVYLAEKGFQVYGIDLSSEGIKKAKQLLVEKGLSAKIKAGSIYQPLPYPDVFFDAVISIRTFHHGRIENIRKAISELRRIIKPGGILFITVRKRTSKKYRHPFKEIAPHTYVPLEGDEKGLIHYLFTKEIIRKEFRGFKIHNLWVDKKKYYCFLGELKGKKIT